MTQFKFAIVAGACKRALAALQAFLNPCPPPADAFADCVRQPRRFFAERLFLS